jgi:hypothetical protein
MSCRHQRLIDLGIQKPLITSDRPIAVQIKSDYLVTGVPLWYDIFRGTLSPPEIVYEPGKDQTSLKWALLNFTGEDRFLDFNLGQCQEAVPLDYDTINEVVYNLMPMAGYNPSVYFQGEHISTFRTNWHPDMPRGEYTLIPKRSDTPGSMLQNFRDTYLANWLMCWRPSPNLTPVGGYKFYLIDPSYYVSPGTPSIFQSDYDAQRFGGLTIQEASKCTIRALKRYYEKPEANQVVVIGADPSKNSLISAYYIDAASQDPTTAPASRPTNWRGRPVPYILVEPSLTTQTSANQSANVLASRIGTGRHLIEFESDLLMYEDPTPVNATAYGQSTGAVADGTNPTISGINNFYANQEVVFDTNIGTNIVAGTSYYIRAGVTGTTFQVSATLGGAAITPNAYGTANVKAPWLLATNTFTNNQAITLKQTIGNFIAGTTYYVKNPTPSGFYLSATSGPGATQYPTVSGSSRINTGTSKLNVVWVGDTVLVKDAWDGVSATLTDLGTFRIVSIPQITFVKEGTDDTSFKMRSCVYKAMQVS